MKNGLASLINLATLLIGIAIGIVISPHVEKQALANSSGLQVTASQPVLPQANSPEIVQGMTLGGPVGTYLLLTHHIQTDELVVNGLDVIKLHQGEINLLAKIPGITQSDIQGVINDARNTHLYQYGSVPKPAPAPSTAPQK